MIHGVHNIKTRFDTVDLSVMIACRLVRAYRPFRGTGCLHLKKSVFTHSLPAFHFTLFIFLFKNSLSTPLPLCFSINSLYLFLRFIVYTTCCSSIHLCLMEFILFNGIGQISNIVFIYLLSESLSLLFLPVSKYFF
jgi:hypothetical protein